MQFVQRLQQAHVLAAGLCKSSDEIVADSLANCVAANELQKLCPATCLDDARKLLLHMMSFDTLLQNYDFAPVVACDVLQLALFDIVLLVDDGSSMGEGTKWSDVKCIAEQIVNMVSHFNCSGLQVEFVHRDERAVGVTCSEDLDVLFHSMQPRGCSPLIQPLTIKVLDPFYSRCRGRRSSLSACASAHDFSGMPPDIQRHVSNIAHVGGEGLPTTPPAATAPPAAAAQLGCAANTPPAAAPQPPSPGCASAGSNVFMRQLQEKRKSRDLKLEETNAPAAASSPSPSPSSPTCAAHASFASSTQHVSHTCAAESSAASPVKPLPVYIITVGG